MNQVIGVEKLAEWQRLKAPVLDSVSSPITRRLYSLALYDSMAWFQQEARPGFTKATVNSWRVSLEARDPSSSSISVRLSAIRKLAVEASDNGLLPPEVAAAIVSVKGVKRSGVRVGNWLSLRQAQDLLSEPDFHPLQLLEDNTTPVLRRTYRPQTAFALPAILITEHAGLAQRLRPNRCGQNSRGRSL